MRPRSDMPTAKIHRIVASSAATAACARAARRTCELTVFSACADAEAPRADRDVIARRSWDD